MGSLLLPFTYTLIEKYSRKKIKNIYKIGLFIFFFILLIVFSWTNNASSQINNDMTKLYEDIVQRSQIDQKLTTSAKDKSVKFRDYFDKSQSKWNEVLEQIYTLIQDGNTQQNKISLIPKAYAKKRRSMRYYVPIIWSLVKAKHQSLETARANIYEAVKNPKYPEWKQILASYGIDDIEQLRSIDDKKLEQIIRDPELQWYIDFKKITKDLWKTAVSTVVEASKMATAWEILNPINWTKDNFIEDLKDGKLDTVWKKLKTQKKWIIAVHTTNTKHLIMAIKSDIKEQIPESILGKKRDTIDNKIKSKLTNTIILKNKSKIMKIHLSNKPDPLIKLDAWKRNISYLSDTTKKDFWDIHIVEWKVIGLDALTNTIKHTSLALNDFYKHFYNRVNHTLSGIVNYYNSSDNNKIIHNTTSKTSTKSTNPTTYQKKETQNKIQKQNSTLTNDKYLQSQKDLCNQERYLQIYADKCMK